MGRLNLAIVLGVLLAAGAAMGSEPLAEVNGKVITAEEVEKSLGGQLAKLQEQMYNLKRARVEALIDEQLLAQAAESQKMSVPALLDREVTAKVGLVTEQEVEGFYKANKGRMKGDDATVRQQVRGYLQNQKLAAQRRQFLESLRAKARVSVNLKAPPVFRADLSVEGAPFKGAENAPVTIVKFEDFHCPFCKRAQATLEQIMSRYSGKVKLAHRDFPIDSLHPQARRAHEAARCAHVQGKFWEYHDMLYDNAPKASLENLKEYAAQVGIETAAFEQCLDSGEFRAAVQGDIEEGQQAGVSGTPAFFINGRLISGAQPISNFVRVIEDELRRAQSQEKKEG